jgi:hypothetical protein
MKFPTFLSMLEKESFLFALSLILADFGVTDFPKLGGKR